WLELEDWLYNPRLSEPLPEGVTPPESMHAFRRHASVAELLRAARESANEQGKLIDARGTNPSGPGFGAQSLKNILKKYQPYPWLKPWLLRGANLPSDVTLVTAQQAKAARQAWHYTKLCRQSGVERHAYLKWIKRKRIPNAYRPWLFGEAEPAS